MISRLTHSVGQARSAFPADTPDPLIRSDCSRRLSLSAVAVAALFMLTGCGPKAMESENEVEVRDGRIMLMVGARSDTVLASASHVLMQERIALRRYEPEEGLAESGFIDIGQYRDFDSEIWDESDRLIKLRFYATVKNSKTFLVCEPLYNPYEIVTHESDYTRLRLVPPGHPGFNVAVALTRRIAAYAEGRAVTAPSY